MTAVLLGHFTQGSDRWHDARSNGIGASECAAVVGLHPYMSGFRLWHEKRGNLPREPENPAMRWGHILEPVVADEFAAEHAEWILTDAGTYAHADRDWQIANPDRLLFDWQIAPFPRSTPDYLLEIKTSRFGDGYGKSGTSDVPLHVRCQVMWQLDVMGLDVGWVAALIGGNDMRTYIIDYDEADAKTLRDAGEAFWRSVQADDEPPIDCSDSTLQTVRALHPDISDDTAPIPVDAWGDYLTTRQLSQKYADDHRGAKSRVLAAMGTARIGTVADTPVLRRQPSGRGGVSLHLIGDTE